MHWNNCSILNVYSVIVQGDDLLILINSQGTNQGNETMADFSYRTV